MKKRKRSLFQTVQEVKLEQIKEVDKFEQAELKVLNSAKKGQFEFAQMLQGQYKRDDTLPSELKARLITDNSSRKTIRRSSLVNSLEIMNHMSMPVLHRRKSSIKREIRQ